MCDKQFFDKIIKKRNMYKIKYFCDKTCFEQAPKVKNKTVNFYTSNKE